MKVQKLAMALLEENSSASNSINSLSSSSTPNLKRLRPLAPKFSPPSSLEPVASAATKGFTSPSGTTRWNPTQEQIRMLESLYQSGMRTPNAQQIENITAELVRYGRIEGKNVFYWFQNHKARERQKHRRKSLLGLSVVAEDGCAFPTTEISPLSVLNASPKGGEKVEEMSDDGRCKRRCRSWGGELNFSEKNGNNGRTLELFPLHPENIQYIARR